MLGRADLNPAFGFTLIFAFLLSPLFLVFAAVKAFFDVAANVFYAIGMLLSCAYCRRLS